MPTLKFQKIHEDAIVPKFANPNDAGMDIHSIEETALLPGEHRLIKTGLKLGIPVGYEIQVRPRSGLALKNKVTVLNSPGTIDSGFRGELGIILMNHNNEPFKINKQDRIAQIVLSKHETPEIVEVDELDETVRGSGGFGSTGI